jgi:PKD repeat protein
MNNNATIGQMKVSPQGTKIGLAIFNVSGPAPFEVYDFDPSTGGVSNAITLGTAASAYGCEFSPNGSKFYGALGGGSLQLYQWDLCAGTSSAIINSKFTFTTVTAVIGSMQLASDGKIYMARNGATLSVINNPNLAGLGANFSNTGLILSSGISQYGLPNFVNSYFKNSTANFSTTIQCLNGSFTSSLVVGQLNSGCSSSSNTISALVWDFGEPSSGTANVGTGQNASHLYASAGTYTVKLKVFYPCYVDSAIQVISLLNVAPQLNVTGQLSICKGDKRTYSCFGASTFTWSNGFVGTSVSLSPTATTVYSVTGTTSNSCSGSKVFTVTVNKCTEVESQLSATNLSVGPNPFDTELVVVSEQQEVLELKDARGVIILELRLEPGINRINTSALAVGVYALKIKGSNFPIKKMIKVH